MELKNLLSEHTMAGRFCESVGDGEVRCYACAHRCRIAEGKSGICRVRFNREGILRVPAGYVSSASIDPIEKKPFYHVLPGREALSFGMLGCNFHCPFCQNWQTSQTLRDAKAVVPPRLISAEDLARAGLDRNVPIVTSTYNEPLITSEWAVEVFKHCRAGGMICGYVSNGFATEKGLDALAEHLVMMNVDLKCFSDESYGKLGGKLQPVLDTIRRLWERKIWCEVITLVVPDFNDSDDELRRIADFLVSVSPNLVWHVSSFHANYKMQTGALRTPNASLIRAAEIGKKAGLHYIYAGNVSGLPDLENTRCHACGTLLIERRGFGVGAVHLSEGKCPHCAAAIPGIWDPAGGVEQ